MYPTSDPRAALVASTDRKKVASTKFSGAEYGKFYETAPQDDDSNGRSWYFRGQNVIVAYSETKPGAGFIRQNQSDEYAILIPEKDVVIEITAAGEKIKVNGNSITFVPPGESNVRVLTGGR